MAKQNADLKPKADLKPNLTLLDRAVSWISPEAGLRRMRFRQALDVALSYDGAKIGRRNDNWITSSTSANADIGPALTRLRDRSRSLIQNNPHAARVPRIISADCIGTGITPRPISGNNKLDDTVSALWEKFNKQGNANDDTPHYAQQALAVRSLIESGEILARFRPRRPTDGLTVPLQIQMLESDHLDSTRMYDTGTTGYVIYGVQFNLFGQREGYWLWNVHPGEISQFFNRDLVSKLVPKSEVMHVFEPLRPGQVRGVPWFAPVITKFHDLAEYDEAELVKKKIESCIALYVTQPEGEEGAGIGVRSTDDDGARRETIRPGMIEYLRPGEQMQAATPSQNSMFSDYWVQQLHSVAVGTNLMYEQLSGDLSRVNYSSWRGGRTAYIPFIEMLRWNVIIPLFCQPVWDRFIATCNLAGLIDTTEVPVEWTGSPVTQSVDPVKDAEADNAEVRAGRMSYPESVRRKGYDYTATLDAIEQTNKELDRRGIVLDIDPRKVDSSGKKIPDPAAANPASGAGAAPAPQPAKGTSTKGAK